MRPRRHPHRARRRPSRAAIGAAAAICAMLITTGCTTVQGRAAAAVTGAGPGAIRATQSAPRTPSPAPPPAAHPATSKPAGSTPSRITRRADPTRKPGAATHPSTPRSGSPTTPPGSLSTGDLIAAATSAAAAAGVTPANPDTPGPQTGPPCPANPKYVNEAPTGLRSDVVTGWRAAVRAAAKKGITLCLNDGKRSRGQQQALLDEYVREYGRTIAEELVLPPHKSAHVIGVAVDVQPATGYRWLQATDGSLGFCRIYDNEPWHFEYNPEYRSTGCPARLPEPER